MIQKRVDNEDFALEIRLEFKDSNEADIAYEKGIEMIVMALGGAIHSGELFPLFLSEFRKVAENMIVAIQTEQAMKGKD